VRRIKYNVRELDLPLSYNRNHTFNMCNPSPFDIGFSNSSTNSLQEGESNESMTLHESILELPKRITRSMVASAGLPEVLKVRLGVRFPLATTHPV